MADTNLFPDEAGFTPRPAWQVIEAARRQYLTGELALPTTPATRIYLRDGMVYFAERSTDGTLPVRLMMEGVITREQMQRGTVIVNGVEHVGRMFDADPTIDRSSVELCAELFTDDVMVDVANTDGQRLRTGTCIGDTRAASTVGTRTACRPPTAVERIAGCRAGDGPSIRRRDADASEPRRPPARPKPQRRGTDRAADRAAATSSTRPPITQAVPSDQARAATSATAATTTTLSNTATAADHAAVPVTPQRRSRPRCRSRCLPRRRRSP